MSEQASEGKPAPPGFRGRRRERRRGFERRGLPGFAAANSHVVVVGCLIAGIFSPDE